MPLTTGELIILATIVISCILLLLVLNVIEAKDYAYTDGYSDGYEDGYFEALVRVGQEDNYKEFTGRDYYAE